MRAKGYVVAYDLKNGELVWTVKVKDVESSHNGRKLAVASLHPGTMLTKPAVDVTFDIQSVSRTVDVGEITDIMAVDVSLGAEAPDDAVRYETTPSSAISFALVEENESVYAMYTECESEGSVKRWLKERSDECHLLAFLELKPWLLRNSEVYGFTEDAEAIFNGLKAMMLSDSARHALETIVTETFELGRKTAKEKGL